MQLGDITEPKIDQAGPPSAGQFTYVDISSVDNKTKRIVEAKRLPADKAPSRARQRLRSGDVLVSMTRPNLNAVALVPPELDGAIGSTGFHVLRARENVLPQWLYYGVQTHQFVGTMSELVQGALYPAVRPKDIRAFDIPLPELNEQRGIVAEIEKQFSRLDEAVANLKRVKANLKRYKAAVLKAAVEGRLVPTEAELSMRDGRTYETGAQLVDRLLQVRRPVTGERGKPKDPAPVKKAITCALPDGWSWATVDAVCSQIVDCPHSTPRFKPEGYPCIDTTWMSEAGLVFERARFVDSVTYNERVARIEPAAGDVVFAREGTIGTAVLVPAGMKPCLGQRVMLLRTSELYSSRLLRHVLHSDFVRSQYVGQALGSTVPHINVGDVKRFVVPVPPIAEQHRLTAEIDRRLSLVSGVEAQVDANLGRARALWQSILANALG